MPVEQWRLDPDGAAALTELARAHPWHEVHHWYSSPEQKARATAAALTDRSPLLLDGRRPVDLGDWSALAFPDLIDVADTDWTHRGDQD